jgi:hypothetical protein
MAPTFYVFVLVACLSGCAIPIVEHRPAESIKVARDTGVLNEVRRLGRDGDWLVIRGYHVTDNLVATLTNTPLSHAAVLDITKDQVIEAESAGVHLSTLPQFVAKSHRLLLIRPVWSDEKTSVEALQKARALVGKKYDFLGLIGLNVPDSFYCSELTLAIYLPYIPKAQIIPRPDEPGQLYFWGRILFDSGIPPDR